MHTAPFRSASCPTPPLGGARPYSLRSLGVLLGILFGVLALLSAGARPARAATYQVTTLADDGSAGSLRAAITSANGSAGTTITFAPGLKGTITLGSDLPALTNNMSIQGPGASVIAVDGNGKYQPFVIYPSVTAALSGLTIQNGNAGTFSGGGVFNAGTLTLTGCALAGNHADGVGGVGGVGGGVYNDVGGTLTLTGCTLTGNSAQDGGGGVYNVGTVTLTGCTLTGNRAVNAGGGVFNGGTVTLTGCTLTGNSAGDGGGVYNNSGTLTLTGCTLTGNSAQDGGVGGVGGGVYNDVGGTLTLTGCTLTGNSAQDSGGGVYNVGTVTLTDDIFYGDSASTGPEFDGSITATYCDFQGLSAAPDSTHNFGADPLLAPLGDYGGPTQTFALLPGSPCLGTGTNAGLAADQRGVAVPQGGRYDIGAFESRGFKVGVTGGSPQSATAGTAFALSLTATVSANFTSEPVAGGLLTFTGPASGASATFSPDPASIGSTGSAAVTATANGVVGGPYSVTADTGAGSAVYSLTNTVIAPPTANAQAVAVAFNTATAITLTGSDPNSPPLSLTYAVLTGPAHGTLTGLNPITGAITYTPKAGFQGPDSFAFQAENFTYKSNVATVTITVAAGTPAAHAQSVTTGQGSAVGITLTGTDPDVPALALTYSVATGPAHGTLTGTAPSLTYTPTAGYSGPDGFTFTASNGTNTSAPATVSITVTQLVAQDVSAQVTVTRGGYYFNRSRNLLQQVLTLTNTGPALAGPVVVAFDGLPQGVAVFRPDGSTVAALPAGSPYLAAVAPGGTLAAGGSVMVPVSYYDPAHVPAPYTPRVLAGSGD